MNTDVEEKDKNVGWKQQNVSELEIRTHPFLVNVTVQSRRNKVSKFGTKHRKMTLYFYLTDLELQQYFCVT